MHVNLIDLENNYLENRNEIHIFAPINNRCLFNTKMKDLKLPLLRVLLSAVFMLCIAWQVIAQSNPEQKQYTILENTLLIDTIESYQYGSDPTIVFQPGAVYSLVSSTNIGGNQFEIVIAFDQDFNGSLSLPVNYWVQYGFFQLPEYIIYNIYVVPSQVIAKDDFYNKTTDTLTLYPLDNDYSNTSSHYLYSLNQVINGQATISGDSILYTGTDDEDIILYSIKDSVGSVDQGVIYLTNADLSYTGDDTIGYTILNSQSKILILPNSSFNIVANPTNGTLANVVSQVFEYKPSDEFTGQDFISFSDGSNSVAYNINVLEALSDVGYIKDDKIHTAINETVVFDAYSNDLVKSGALINFSSDLSVVSPGVFSFTPPSNYQGNIALSYTKNFGASIETGQITITVGNYNPTKDFPYEFEVLKGKDFLIEYEVPLSGYSFNILNNPTHGIAQSFEIIDTFYGDCDSKSKFVGINYKPDASYTGLDEFDIEYCINGGQCEFYKLRFNVVSPLVDSLCNCIDDCVWAGDANADGRVSVTDLLSVGRYMGFGGEIKSMTDQGIWTGANGNDWVSDQVNGKNTKHIDSDNNGVVTDADVNLIEDNYGKVNTLVPTEILAFKDYPFYLIPNETELDSGDLLILQIGIGSSSYPVKDLHGLTFSFSINPSLIDSASAQLEFYDNTWFTNQSPTLDLTIHKSEGKLDVGYTRTNGIGVSGAGIIGQLSFIVEEDVEGIKTSELLERIRHYVYLQNAQIEDMYGNRFSLPDTEVGFDILLNKGGSDFEGQLVVFPNPAQDQITLHFNGRNTINDVVVYDMAGRAVHTQYDINNQHVDINSSNWNEGIYIIQSATNQGTITKRMNITR